MKSKHFRIKTFARKKSRWLESARNELKTKTIVFQEEIITKIIKLHLLNLRSVNLSRASLRMQWKC